MDRYFIFLSSQKFEMDNIVFNYIEQCFLSLEQYFIFVNNKSHYLIYLNYSYAIPLIVIFKIFL